MSQITLSRTGQSRKKKGVFSLKPYLFLLPMVVFAVGFVYYPFFKTCVQSVSNVNFRGEITGFVGL